ncbi:MAG: DUF58 domain-containing protein [Flavobacterium sp. BFFFF2]|nr:MAG: DUF58 domain-containing protein [Flavobacterium sp. BFFFF2]
MIALSVLFCVSFFYPAFFLFCQLLGWTWMLLLAIDLFRLYSKSDLLTAERIAPERLSNGDDNAIKIILNNSSKVAAHCRIFDETPAQFQLRNLSWNRFLTPNEPIEIGYFLKPVARGIYSFGHVNVLIQSPWGFFERKIVSGTPIDLPCYPSFLHLGKYELLVKGHVRGAKGTKRVRHAGQTLEFEQIKEYVLGDDYRMVNWKATAKRNKLMMNQYQDERARPVYMLLDMGRVMQLPFGGMTLLDYAINATLALTQTVLSKQDKVGMLGFSNRQLAWIEAENKSTQMRRMMNQLYPLQTDFKESDYNHLYARLLFLIPQRSFLMLFTNFETWQALERQLPYLQAIAKRHLLMVVFFENTEIVDLSNEKPTGLNSSIQQVLAENMVSDKRLIIRKLRQYGIRAMLTTPEKLTINAINAYLDTKSEGVV